MYTDTQGTEFRLLEQRRNEVMRFYKYIMEDMKKKDLFKPGRPINEYLNKDGTLIKHCITCIHRYNMNESPLGGWLCRGGEKKHMECHPNFNKACETNDTENMHQWLLWEPRVNEGLIDEDEFKLD